VCLAVVLTVIAGVAAPARAQLAQGRLIGKVVDAQGAVLPGVAVTATSPALIGSQTTTTATDGVYGFPSLPPGDYALAFQLTGFRGVRRENITLQVGKTLGIDVTLEVAALTEAVSVTADSPLIDIASTKIGETFSGAKLLDVPTATDIWAALAMSPGTRLQGFDVGGSHKSQQMSFTSFGMNDQHKVILDGVDASEGSSASGIYADFLSAQEIQVTGAGHDIEMSSAGAAVISTYKAGGNQLKGLGTINYEGNSFVSNNSSPDLVARGFTGNRNLKFWEGHAEVGGPILRDRIWFFAAVNHFTIDRTVSGVTEEQGTDLGQFDTFTTKETVKVDDRSTGTFYFQRGRKYKPYRGLSATNPMESTYVQDSVTKLVKGEYQRAWTNRFFTDVRVATYAFNWPSTANADYTVTPPRYDLGTGATSGAYFYTSTSTEDRPQTQIVSTYYLPSRAGSHDLKWGYEWQDDKTNGGSNGESGPINYYDMNGQPYLIYLYDYGAAGQYGDGWGGKGQHNVKNTLYLQDRWSPVSRVSITAGLRYERHRMGYLGGTRAPIWSTVFSTQDIPETTVLSRNLWSPRLALTAALTKDSKTVVKAAWGRYPHNTGPSGVAYYEDPAGDNYQMRYFNDLNGNKLLDGPSELGALVSSSGGAYSSVDRGLVIPHTDELSLSLEQQFLGESSLRVAFVRKSSSDLYGLIRPAWEGQFSTPYSYTTTLRDYGSTDSTTKTYNLTDVPAALAGQAQQLTNIAGENGHNSHNVLTLAYNKRFHSKAFVYASYDYQWNDTVKYPASFGGPLYTSEFSDSYSQPGNINQLNVPLRQPTRSWQFRATGRYELPFGTAAAVNFQSESGFNYARYLSVTMPNAGFAYFFDEPITSHRSDTVSLLGIRLEKGFAVDRLKLKATLDVFNLLNANTVTAFVLTNGTNYGKVTGTLEPRAAVIGLRCEF
jgi:hypothetical protein